MSECLAWGICTSVLRRAVLKQVFLQLEEVGWRVSQELQADQECNQHFLPDSNWSRRSQGRLRGERKVTDLPHNIFDAHTSYLTPGSISMQKFAHLFVFALSSSCLLKKRNSTIMCATSLTKSCISCIFTEGKHQTKVSRESPLTLHIYDHL